VLVTGQLSKLITAHHIVPVMRQVLPDCSEREVALAVVAVLNEQLNSEASERGGGATAHVMEMRKVNGH
jgi:uncharacterized protein GlcG (DUF336 family)